jgi:phosphopantothenoylcysteine decarboxylase/phosphopantothenate--cysteine ligase
MDFYLRKPGSVVAMDGRRVIIIDGERVHYLPDVDHQQLSLLIERTSRPTHRDDLLALIEQSSVDLLIELGLLLTGSEEALASSLVDSIKDDSAVIADQLVVGLTGAIGAADMARVIRTLRRRFFRRVDVILTAAALRFVSASVFDWYGVPVWTDEFEVRGDIRVPHIHLAEVADLFLIMPASAHTIHKLASAACSDLLSLAVAATKAPVVLVPAMNESMWNNPAVQRNVRDLREAGHWVVEPTYGIEVSSGLASELTLGAMGVTPQTLATLLTAVKRDRAL